ncbi:MAG: PEGA domain-containing protein [Vicinamibacterales bacterium]
MTTVTRLLTVGALVMASSMVGYTADAGQRDREGRDRNGRASQGGGPPRDGGSVERRGGDAGRPGNQGRDDRRAVERDRRNSAPDRGVPDRVERGRPVPPPSAYRYDNRGRDDRYRYDNRYRYDRRYDYYRPYAPRVYRPAPRRYYGPGGNFSVYFGLGNGYYYGSPWSGRVYGYRAPYAAGARIYYGDVRLQVHPRHAAVYVDGYYAGVVDNFDGVFQRLTLEVGPHTIEIDAPGYEPQVFDVYVDPARTTTIRTDLFR